MERVAGTHQRGSYGLAIRSPLSVNFAGGARRAGSYRARRPKSVLPGRWGCPCPLLAVACPSRVPWLRLKLRVRDGVREKRLGGFGSRSG